MLPFSASFLFQAFAGPDFFTKTLYCYTTSKIQDQEVKSDLNCFVLLCFLVHSPKKRKSFSKSDRVSDIAMDLAPQGPSLAEDEELVLQLLSGT